MKELFFIMMTFITNVSCVFAGNFHIDNVSSALQAELRSSQLWQPQCPVSPKDLRAVSVSYYDFLGKVHHDGKLLIHKSAAQATMAIFKKLYEKKFPFSSIDTLISFKGDIAAAEEKNITYGFICRFTSQHHFLPGSWGNVLTINPIFNPEIIYNSHNQYIEVSPNKAIFSINRRLKLTGMSEIIAPILKVHHFLRLNLNDNQVGWKKFIFLSQLPLQRQAEKIAKITPAYLNQPIFQYQPLSIEMVNHLKKSGSWFAGCPVSPQRLNLLVLSYYGFDDQTHIGHLIVFDAIAPRILSAFKALYRKHYPLEAFEINGNASSENTSGFNCRNMVGKKNFSIHSYGLALDINVSRNPYIGAYYKDRHQQMIGTIVPAAIGSLAYLNREIKRPGMNESIVEIFKKFGLIEWGGDWQDTTDYMHFQVPTNIAQHLVLLDKKSAEQLISLTIKYQNASHYMSADTRWDHLYEMYPHQYMIVLKKYFPLLKTKKEAEIIHLIFDELASSQNKNAS